MSLNADFSHHVANVKEEDIRTSENDKCESRAKQNADDDYFPVPSIVIPTFTSPPLHSPSQKLHNVYYQLYIDKETVAAVKIPRNPKPSSLVMPPFVIDPDFPVPVDSIGLTQSYSSSNDSSTDNLSVIIRDRPWSDPYSMFDDELSVITDSELTDTISQEGLRSNEYNPLGYLNQDEFFTSKEICFDYIAPLEMDESVQEWERLHDDGCPLLSDLSSTWNDVTTSIMDNVAASVLCPFLSTKSIPANNWSKRGTKRLFDGGSRQCVKKSPHNYEVGYISMHQ